MKLPKIRTENLLEQNLEKETLIYDLAINKALKLNETSTIIYKACSENQTFDELKRKHKFTDEIIYFALDELKESNLINDENYVSPFAGISRREVIKKVGLTSIVALPIITGLIAPKAVNAASSCPDPFSGIGLIPNGCVTGGGVSDPSINCAASDTERSNTCNAFTVIRERCTSGTAGYGGVCSDSGPNGSFYNCICV